MRSLSSVPKATIICEVRPEALDAWRDAFLGLASQDLGAIEVLVPADHRSIAAEALGDRVVGLALADAVDRPMLGQAPSRARGEFLIILDRPHGLPSDYVRQAVVALEADPRLDIVYGDRRRSSEFHALEPSPPADLRRLLHADVVAPAAVMRRTLLEELGPFRDELAEHALWEFWIRAALHGRQPVRRPELLVWVAEQPTESADRAAEALARAQIVALHRDHFGPMEIAWANATIGDPAGAALDRSRSGVIPSLPQEAVNRSAEPRYGVVWEGTQFVTHSLALINRELALRMIAHGHEVALKLYEDHQWGADLDPRYRSLAERFDRRPLGPVDFHVRHQWPPRLDAPAEGRWIVIQPWEWGAVPKAWIRPFADDVDEIWTPSAFVRSCYFRAGIPAERVRVIPNGFDPARFNDRGAAMRLRTKKRFKFLFVGGTIRRKGVDILLDAYRRTFSRSDDVCLVIKDLGGASFYRGQTMAATIERFQADPGAPEVEYLDRDFDESAMAALYRAADVLVHPYRGEGFGLPILEAMACGVPVIVTGYGPALEFTRDDCAWYVEAREVSTGRSHVGDLETTEPIWLAEPDVVVLGARLREAAGDRTVTSAKGKRAAERAHAAYTWEHVDALVQERLAVLAKRAPRRFRRPAADPFGRVSPNASPTALHVDLARAAALRGETRIAVDHVEAALDREPASIAALLQGAALARSRCEHDEAAHYVARALRAAPRHPDALAAYADLCLDLGHRAGAAEATESLARVAPTHALLAGLQEKLARRA